VNQYGPQESWPCFPVGHHSGEHCAVSETSGRPSAPSGFASERQRALHEEAPFLLGSQGEALVDVFVRPYGRGRKRDVSAWSPGQES
jgi:hypothetical protein